MGKLSGRRCGYDVRLSYELFRSDPLTNMAAIGNSCFWLEIKKIYIFLSKLLSQMNRNLVGSTYGKSSIRFSHFIPIGQKTVGMGNSCFSLAEI